MAESVCVKKKMKYYLWSEEDKNKLERAVIRHKRRTNIRWSKVAKDMDNPMLTAEKCRSMHKIINWKRDRDPLEDIIRRAQLAKTNNHDDDKEPPLTMNKKERMDLFSATRDCDVANIDFDQLSFTLFDGKFSALFLKDYYDKWLDPNMSHSNWTDEETNILMRYVAAEEEENRKVDWWTIAKKINRTKIQCIARFYYITHKPVNLDE